MFLLDRTSLPWWIEAPPRRHPLEASFALLRAWWLRTRSGPGPGPRMSEGWLVQHEIEAAKRLDG